MITDFALIPLKLLNFIYTTFQLNKLVEFVEDIFSLRESITEQLDLYLSYIFFFIDKPIFITVVTLSIALLVISLIFAVVNLIWP